MKKLIIKLLVVSALIFLGGLLVAFVTSDVLKFWYRFVIFGAPGGYLIGGLIAIFVNRY